MGKADEASIQNAIQSVKSGVSVNQSAIRWGVPRSTLGHRLKGKGSHQTGSEPLQRLSRQQEIHLCGWAITETASGNPPTHRRLCDIATKILVAKGDLRPLGRNWVDAFFRRNPELKLSQAALAAERRAQSPNDEPLTEPFPNGLFSGQLPSAQIPSDEFISDQLQIDQLQSGQLQSDQSPESMDQ